MSKKFLRKNKVTDTPENLTEERDQNSTQLFSLLVSNRNDHLEAGTIVEAPMLETNPSDLGIDFVSNRKRKLPKVTVFRKRSKENTGNGYITKSNEISINSIF
jgi:hypothetical protein